MKEAADTSGAVTEGRVATLQNHATLSNITQHFPTLYNIISLELLKNDASTIAFNEEN